MLETTLRKTGLTNGEIKVYLALARLGTSTVGPIIDKAKVSSSKVYVILEKLIRKGLASYITQEKTKHFQATEPTALVDYVNQQQEQLEETKQSLTKAMQQISAMKRSAREEEARIYKGFKGMLTALVEASNTIDVGGKYYFFSPGYGEDDRMNTFFKRLTTKLQKRSIQLTGLAPDSQRVIYKKYFTKKEGYNMRYTDTPWPTDVSIVGDYVLILHVEGSEPVIYSIYSPTLAKSYVEYFKTIWKTAKL